MKIKDKTTKNSKVIFPTCDYCGHKLKALPYRCRRCHGKFCDDHRLPEDHECPGLSQIKKTKSIKNLISLLVNTNQNERRIAAQQLEKRSWIPQTDAEKINYLYAHQRWDDLVSLGSASLDPLISGLMDDDSTIRASSAKSLSKINNPQAIEHLIKKFNDHNYRVRSEVANALENLGWVPKNEREKIELLIAKCQWQEIIQIGQKSIDPLSVLLEDENEEIRFHIVSTLCKIREDRIIEPLTKALQDNSKKVKLTALYGLVNLKKRKTIYGLLIALKDADSEIQKIALNGLIQLDSDAVDALMGALSFALKKFNDDLNTTNRYKSDSELNEKHPEIFFISNICLALGEIQDIRSRDMLIKISTTAKSDVIKESANVAVKKIDVQLNTLKQKSNLYCLKCFSNYTKDKQSFIPFFNSSIVPTCRNCKSNKSYLENVHKVVLFLGELNEPNNFKNNVLKINWFKIKRPIDMNEIVIIKATNDDIAELVMKLRNDDDSDRKQKYKHLPVVISKDLNISQAKINLLEYTFGNVHVVEKDTINRLGE